MSLPSTYFKRVWTPDYYFHNSVKIEVGELGMIMVFPDGNVY